MQALRVLGISEGGEYLVCTDDNDPAGSPANDAAAFTLPNDERLRAAIRGDLSRFGQLEIEMASQLRPKEIQSRIRAGASVEQVAAAAGCAPDRIERYAYPVLMEREAIAERARHIRPLQGAAIGSLSAANAERSLEDIVIETLSARGQRQDVAWDAFKDERGWAVTLTWRAGRTENRAEWAFAMRADGGSITARNAEAADVVEPTPTPAPLRTVNTAPTGDESRSTRQEHTVTGAVTDERAGARIPPSSASHTASPGGAQPGGSESGRSATSNARARTGTEDAAAEDKSPRRTARRGHRPPMPSWEDVLLGTRSS